VVASKFSFLLDRGFRYSVESDESVLYESPDGIFVRVFRDPRDRYVGFRAGLASRPRDALTVPEFARLTGATTKGDYPETTSELHVDADRLARLLEDYGERVLAGDETILDEAMVLRSEYTKSFTRSESPNEQRDKDT
jgi:hypothetical protein